MGHFRNNVFCLLEANLTAYFFFFNATAPTEIYTSVNTLSLHDALPIYHRHPAAHAVPDDDRPVQRLGLGDGDRSEEHTSELQSLTDTSYAVLCLKKKRVKRPSCRSEEHTSELQSLNDNSYD